MEHLTSAKILFENRRDAGDKLAAELGQFANNSVVLAIPNGGVPIGVSVADHLNAELEVIVSRKIPMPLSPEGGLGAITDDGTIILNKEIVKRDKITPEQIEYEANKVRNNIKQRSLKYKGNRLLVSVTGKTVILVDDGLASGITMMAAMASVRHRRPKAVVVAVPVASEWAAEKVAGAADKLIMCAIASVKKFYVADYYRNWRDLKDEEVIRSLEQWRLRRMYE